MTPPARRPGRFVAAGLVAMILVLLGLVIALWWRGREPRGPIHALRGVDDHRVLLVREGYQKHGFVHVTLRDLERGQVWSVPFRDAPHDTRPAFTEGRAAVWVRNHEGKVELHAFDLEHGTFAYRAGATAVPAGVTPSVGLVAVGDRFVGAVTAGETTLFVIEAASGRVIAQHGLGRAGTAPVLRVLGTAVEVAPEQGETRRVDARHGALFLLPPGFAAAGAPPSPVDRIARRVCATGTTTCVEAEGGAAIRDADRAGDVLWVATGSTFAAVDLGHATLKASEGPATLRVVPRAP